MSDIHETDLASWWRSRTEQEIQATVPKAVEYGSRDLIELGRDCAEILGRDGVSEAEAIEIAVWFYVRGKMARWTAALRRGEQVGDDTPFDIGIYVKMLQRVRAVGSWPGDSDILADKSNSLLDDAGSAPRVDFNNPPADAPLTTSPVVNIEVSGPPDEAEIAGAQTRVDAMRAIHEFRAKLKKVGFREFNSVGELIHDEHGLKVSTQYESMGDWRVKVWHGRNLTINEFIPRDRAKQALYNLSAIEWRSV